MSDQEPQIVTPEKEEENRDDVKNNGRDDETQKNINSNADNKDDGKDPQKHVEPSATKTVNTSAKKSTRQPKPTLPNVLTQYGLEDKSFKAKKKESKKKKRRHKTVDDDDDDKETLMRQKERDDERHLQVMDDMEKLYKYMHAQYMEKLQHHVTKQRSQIQQKAQEIEEKKRLKIEQHKKENEESRQRRMKRHTLKHDTEFLKNVAKTDISRIVRLMDQKVKSGELKTRSDLDAFWEKIQKPEVFHSYFKVSKMNEPYEPEESLDASIAASDNEESDAVFERLHDHNVRALSQITEGSKESPRPDTGSDWAVTQQMKHQHHGSADPLSLRRHSATQVAKQAANDLDKRCPRLEMPKMQCFTIDLSRKLPDASEIARKEALIEKERNRKIFLKKLRKMHQMAMTHTAAANRILAGHENDLMLSLEGSNLEDLIWSYEFFKPAYPEESSYYEDRIFITETTQDIGDRPGRDSREEASRKSSASSHKSRSSILSSDSSLRPRPGRRPFKKRQVTSSSVHLPHLPLTMNDLSSNQSKVMEAKCMSSNWSNYLNAGKSVFSPS